MTFGMIAPDEIEKYIEDPESQIIDVREKTDYVQKHIRGSINIPYREWSAFEKNGLYARLFQEKNIILYCERGPASFAAARELAEKGIRVSVMVGGIHAYHGKMTERY